MTTFEREQLSGHGASKFGNKSTRYNFTGRHHGPSLHCGSEPLARVPIPLLCTFQLSHCYVLFSFSVCTDIGVVVVMLRHRIYRRLFGGVDPPIRELLVCCSPDKHSNIIFFLNYGGSRSVVFTIYMPTFPNTFTQVS